MSTQRNPKLIDLDFTNPDRRAPVPPAVLAMEGTPTEEIRSLMNQLQQTAYEARHRLSAVEDERDHLAQRVALLQAQNDELRTVSNEAMGLSQKLEALRRENMDLQTKLAEHTTHEQHARIALQDAQSRLQGADRKYQDAVRQREELNRSLDALRRSYLEVNERFQGTQTQIMNLRQARDAAQSQNRELSLKIAAREDELADLRDQLEDLEEKRQHELLGQGNAEAEALRQELATVRAELETLRSQGGAAAPAGDWSFERTALEQAQSEAMRQVELLQAEMVELRARAENPEQNERRNAETEMVIADLKQQIETIAAERDEAQAACGTAAAEIAKVAMERDLLSAQGREKLSYLEAELATSRAEATAMVGHAAAELTEELSNENVTLRQRLEAQRLETIELATRFQEAQDEIRQLSALLAELRLQARMGARNAEGGAAFKPETKNVTPPPAPVAAAPVVKAPAAPAPAPAAASTASTAAVVPAGPFATAEVQDDIRAMRRCFQAFVKTPDDLSHLNELYCVVHRLAEDAQARGFVAVSRLAEAFASLVRELYEVPEQLSPAVLSTVSQTIEFFQTLQKVRDLHLLQDPAEAVVCVVDDDPATCECVLMAVESASMQAKGFSDPAEALRSIGETPYDLIALDIHMPGMDGFEVCAELRQRPQHKDTPVVFITGQCGQEMRSRSALCGGNDFVGKPFLLCEVGLKCLLLFAKNKLHMA